RADDFEYELNLNPNHTLPIEEGAFDFENNHKLNPNQLLPLKGGREGCKSCLKMAIIIQPKRHLPQTPSSKRGLLILIRNDKLNPNQPPPIEEKTFDSDNNHKLNSNQAPHFEGRAGKGCI